MVIAGDPQQLPPTVSAPQAVAAQLDRTVFERLQVRPCSLRPCWVLFTICCPLAPTCRVAYSLYPLHSWPLQQSCCPKRIEGSLCVTRLNLASRLWGSSKRLAAVQACGLQPWLLDTQYRMHPAIAEFPSRLFYKGRIQTGLSPEERPLPPGAPQPASQL